MSPSTPGITLRDLAGTGFDYRVTWGEADVLLVRPGSAPAGHTTPTPRDLGLVDTAELITGASAAQLNAFLLPECLVLPLRKSTRNPFGELIVGRAATCDIVLLDRSVIDARLIAARRQAARALPSALAGCASPPPNRGLHLVRLGSPSPRAVH